MSETFIWNSQYFISIKLPRKFFLNKIHISVFPGAFPIRKVKPSRHDVVHIYHFKCILYSRHFFKKKKNCLRFCSFSINIRERQRQRSPIVAKLRASGKIIWVKISTLTFTLLLLFESKAGKQRKKSFRPIKKIKITTFTGLDHLYF